MISSKSAQGFATLERRKTIDTSSPTTLQPSLHQDSIFQAVVESPSPQDPPQPSPTRENDVGRIIGKCQFPGVITKPRSNSSSDVVDEKREVLDHESLPPGPLQTCLRLSKARFSVDVLGASSLLPSPSSSSSNVAASPNTATPSTPSSGPLAIISAESGGRWRADSDGSAVTTTGNFLVPYYVNLF